MKTLFRLLLITMGLFWSNWGIFAQSITLPPSGDNQKASVSQWIGLVELNVTYNSPNVTGPRGEDRTGQIWGKLVHQGYADQGFGPSKAAPWRAGANENTVFSTSHDIQVEGQPLPAGKYGLFMAVGKEGEDWTLIFSKNHSSWGSYFYEPKEDALRVTVKPQVADFHEFLTYEFTEREKDRATLTMAWENVKVPIQITIPHINELYFAKISEELRSAPGFTWQNWQAAAMFCFQQNIYLEEALGFAEKAISEPFVGERNFSTLQTKAMILGKLNREAEANAVMSEAIKLPGVSPVQIHSYGRMLLSQKKSKEALDVFLINAEKHPNTWPVNVGLARGYSAVGEYKKALKFAKLAAAEAPDKVNKDAMTEAVKKLEQNQDIN